MLGFKDIAPNLPLPQQENNRTQLGSYRELPEAEISSMMGENYMRAIKTVYSLNDSFGLCGVLAIHASGQMTLPEAWQSVTYDVNELKQIFDKKMANDGTGQSAVEAIRERYANIGANSFSSFAIESNDQLSDSFDNLRENQGLVVALVVDYEKYTGKHTHWLAVRRNNNDKNKVIVLGDLSPFGVKSYGIEMDASQLAESLSSVIGQKSTSKLTTALTKPGHRDAFFNQGESFQVNAGVFSFKKPA